MIGVRFSEIKIENYLR